jgi:hypothetical protein
MSAGVVQLLHASSMHQVCFRYEGDIKEVCISYEVRRLTGL